MTRKQLAAKYRAIQQKAAAWSVPSSEIAQAWTQEVFMHAGLIAARLECRQLTNAALRQMFTRWRDNAAFLLPETDPRLTTHIASRRADIWLNEQALADLAHNTKGVRNAR